MGSDYFSLVCHYFILPGLLQQPSCFHSTPYSLFSTKQPNSIFKNLSQIISLLCSKSYNNSQLTPSKSQSPYNDKQCSTGWFFSTLKSSPPLHLTHCSTATLPFFLFLEQESHSYFKASELLASPGILSPPFKHGLHLHFLISALIQLLR